MGYDEFSTTKAKYVARYGRHAKNYTVPEKIFGIKKNACDAVILEVRGSKVWTSGSVTKALRDSIGLRFCLLDIQIIEYSYRLIDVLGLRLLLSCLRLSFLRIQTLSCLVPWVS